MRERWATGVPESGSIRAVAPYRSQEPSPSAVTLVMPLGGRTSLPGVVFCAIAALTFAVALKDETPASYGLVPITTLAVGLVWLLQGRGAIVDRSAGTLTAWWGLVRPAWPLRSATTRLGAVTHVSVGARTEGSRGQRTTVFPVRIEPSAGEVWAPERYEVARASAERIARQLGTSLHDESSGVLVVREAATLDEPLRARVRREGALPPAPPAVPARFAVETEGDETLCALPPRGVGYEAVLGLLTGVGYAAVGYFVLRQFTPAAFGARVATAALVALAALVAFVVAARGRATVRFSARRVACSPATPWRRSLAIEADAIEDLLLVDVPRIGAFGPTTERARSIWLRSDARTLRLGADLTAEEAAWLHASICRALCGEAR